MGRGLHRLSAIGVAGRKRPGYYVDGGGLYLRVAPGGSKGWVFRFTQAGKTREAGLGGCSAVSLAAAREAAQLGTEVGSATATLPYLEQPMTRLPATTHTENTLFSEIFWWAPCRDRHAPARRAARRLVPGTPAAALAL